MVQRAFFLLIPLFLSACIGASTTMPVASQAVDSTPPAPDMTRIPEGASTPSPFPTNVREEDAKEYRIPSSLGFDAIPPIYEPRFVPAQESPLLADELVMGVALGGEAKAYPVTVLRSREMVNDEIAGWPVLVSW
jgi:hypothetical protein